MQRRGEPHRGGNPTQPGKLKLDPVLRSRTGQKQGSWAASGCRSASLHKHKAGCPPAGSGKETGRIWVEMNRNCSDEQKAWLYKEVVVNTYE